MERNHKPVSLPAQSVRAMRPLIDMRLVLSGKIINKSYRARQEAYARQAYIRHAQKEFERLFGEIYRQTNSRDRRSGD